MFYYSSNYVESLKPVLRIEDVVQKTKRSVEIFDSSSIIRITINFDLPGMGK